MGGATRFMTLLTTPVTPLRPSFIIILRRRFSSISVAPRRLLALSSPSTTKPLNPQLVICLHSQPTNTPFAVQSSAAQHHPWPEWTNFLNILSNGQGLSAHEEQGIPPEDAFVVYEELSDDFVRAAAVCITFARARPNLLGLLSRRDIELVVLNGTPFLFKSALDTARRMRAFLGGTDGSNVSELDKANTVDLMKYILSYTSNSNVSSERKGLYSRELVDSSVRNLLREMCTVCSGVPTGYTPASRQSQMPFGQNIEMKRGDWICQKCNFMNFAKNMKCLECEEARPKKQLTGVEWDCPQCNFFNYGRNMVCLRCDGRRPGAPLYNNNSSQFNSGYNGNPSYKTNTGNRLTGNEEKAQQRFSKISQLNHEDDSNNAAAMKIENRLSSPQHQKQFSNIGESSRWIDGIHNKDKEQTDVGSENFHLPKDSASQKDNHDKENEQAQKSERWFKKMSELHDVKDLPSAVSDEDFPEIMPMRTGENRFAVSKKKDRSLTSPNYKRQVPTDQANTTSFVPFVPFPPGYFSKKEDTNQSTGQALHVEPDTKPMKPESSNYSSGVAASKMGPPESSNYSSRNTASNVGPPENNWSGKSLEGSAVKEGDPLDMSEEAKAERWFKRVAQIKDISELSQIPDEDFPSIMPMRKGVNRFVVSKRKTPLERRLTSQQYRRNLPVVSSDSVKEDE